MILNIAVGVFSAVVGCWMCALAFADDPHGPRWLFAILAVLNISLAVLNIVKGVVGGVA